MRKKIKKFIARILFKPIAWIFAEVAEEVYDCSVRCFYCGRKYGKHHNS